MDNTLYFNALLRFLRQTVTEIQEYGQFKTQFISVPKFYYNKAQKILASYVCV